MSSALRGIITPLVTPLTPDEGLDEDALRRLLQFQVKNGIHGIFVLGTCGEGNALSDTVRASVVRIASEELGGHVPLLAGCGGTCTREVTERVNHAEANGADVAILTLPHYHTLGSQEQVIAFVEAVLEKTRLPLGLYNLPSKTGLAYAVSSVVRLAEHARVAAVKDSSGDFTYTQALIAALRDRPDVAVMTGAPWHTGAAVLMGAAGAVAAPANFDPAGAVELYEAASSGDIQRTRALQERMTRIREIYGAYGMLPGLKFVLKLRGLCDDVLAAPLASLTDAQKADTQARLPKDLLA